MGFYPELDTQSLEQLVRAFQADTPTDPDVSPEEWPLWLDEVAVAIAQRGDQGLEYLLQQIDHVDEDRVHAVLLGFCFARKDHPGNARMCALAHRFLHDLRPRVVAQAIYTLRHLECAVPFEEVRPFLNHSSPYVVGSALRFFGKRAPDEARPILLDALKSTDPIIRENAADILDDLGATEALPALRPLLQDGDADVRQAAATAVANLEDLLQDGVETPSP